MIRRLAWPSALIGLTALNVACQATQPSMPEGPEPAPAAIARPSEVRPYVDAAVSGETPTAAAPSVASPQPTASPLLNALDAPAPTSIGPVAPLIPFNVLRVNGAFEPQIPDLDLLGGLGLDLDLDLDLNLGLDLDVVLLDFKARTVLDLVGIDTPAVEFRPLATADGSSIFYVTNKAGNLDIWRYDVKTRRNDTMSYLNTEDQEYSHAISMDGHYIVYVQGPLLGEQRLFRQSTKTGERSGFGGYTRLSDLRAIRNLTCNVDATRVAFAGNNEHDADIFLMDFNTGIEQTPPFVNTIFNETFPWLSPDGNLLLFVSDRAGSPDIYFLDLRNGRLDNMPFANTKAIETFPFFIGGTQIMFLSNRGGRFRLYRYDWITGVLDTLSWIDANHQLPPLLPLLP